MKTLAVACGLLVALASLPAAAQSRSPDLYIGAFGGKSTVIDACALGAPPCNEKRGTAYRIFAGYQLARSLAVEIGWSGFGNTVVGGADIRSDAADVSGVATLPLTTRLSLLGRGGVYHGTMRGGGREGRNYGGLLGVGLQYDFGGFALRAEGSRYFGMGGGGFDAKTDVDVLGAAFLVRF